VFVRGTGLILAGLALLGALPAPALAEPQRYEMGLFITAVHDLDLQKKTAGVDLWLWSISKDKRRPVDTTEFPNANEVRRESSFAVSRKAGLWSSVKILGTFRQNWDLRNFPFDRQTIEVIVEEAEDDITALEYDVDTIESSYSQQIHLDGWIITGFSVQPARQRYQTTFGDPDLPSGSGSTYARMTATLNIERHQVATFFTFTSGLYAAVIISLISFFLTTENASLMSARVSLVVAALFAAVLNMRSAQDVTGEVSGASLLDKIHILGLVFIAVATVLAVVSRLRVERGHDPAAVQRASVRTFVVALPVYAVLNVLLAVAAVNSG
jgi:hypothetical protein